MGCSARTLALRVQFRRRFDSSPGVAGRWLQTVFRRRLPQLRAASGAWRVQFPFGGAAQTDSRAAKDRGLFIAFGKHSRQTAAPPTTTQELSRRPCAKEHSLPHLHCLELESRGHFAELSLQTLQLLLTSKHVLRKAATQKRRVGWRLRRKRNSQNTNPLEVGKRTADRSLSCARRSSSSFFC